ncbi:helix-turn-helix domain-containing protein [Terasakiella sp.]|uniref:helix-turn-helix domain-containing protein n=1 Tax=Terasakiella sp. TaxID=2034861 RepID=UPI003AA92BF8
MDQNTTYSMIVAQLLDFQRKTMGLKQADFFRASGISQSSWARVNRGISHFTLEEMRAACRVLGVELTKILEEADEASEKLPNQEGIAVLENLKGSENKSLVPTIIAGAALGFLISRLLNK